MTLNQIHVLIVDDSAVVRRTLSEILSEAAGFGQIDTAADPIFARRKMEQAWPDVIVLDIEMPRMDGLTFLRQIMQERPTPVLICSSLTQAGAHKSVEALALGAIDTIAKPAVGLKNYLDSARANLVNSIKTAGRIGRKASPGLHVRMGKAGETPAAPTNTGSVQNTDRRAPQGDKSIHSVVAIDAPVRRRGVIAIGASAGGTVALDRVLGELSPDCPGIVIVQHMPASFTGPFAERLNKGSRMEVREASPGDLIRKGLALIAPGDQHMELQRAAGGGYCVALKSGPPINRHRPSVDVLFRSVAAMAAADAIGVILTGMGDDGAAGLLEMRAAGATTIAQDEATSTVFGMPREALRRGAALSALALDSIPGELQRLNGVQAIQT
ncbi:MAG: chemotaxis response regulator protein-glutamate methylesterase [bacterium]|nr:chemotaxis response regulator protein-glutamate methylesterase [bacterium]